MPTISKATSRGSPATTHPSSLKISTACTAAAALLFPIAFGLAESYGLSHMPFIMAVAYGASASFLTPYGYTTNLMIQNMGGYRFRDYTRAGLPLSIAYSVTVIALLPLVFPFGV